MSKSEDEDSDAVSHVVWKLVGHSGSGENYKATHRARVPGGWLWRVEVSRSEALRWGISPDIFTTFIPEHPTTPSG